MGVLLNFSLILFFTCWMCVFIFHTFLFGWRKCPQADNVQCSPPAPISNFFFGFHLLWIESSQCSLCENHHLSCLSLFVDFSTKSCVLPTQPRGGVACPKYPGTWPKAPKNQKTAHFWPRFRTDAQAGTTQDPPTPVGEISPDEKWPAQPWGLPHLQN